MCSNASAAGPAPLADTMAALRTAVDAVVGIDARSLSGSAAQELAGELVEAIARLTGARLATIPVIRDAGSWGLDGSRSLAWALVRGEDAGIASIRAEITLASTLEQDLPLTAACLRAGALSLDKAKLIARLAPSSELRRAALRDADTGEAFLLAKAAELDVWGLSRAVRFWAYRVDPDAVDQAYRDAVRTHELTLADTVDGTHVRGFLTHENGELLRTALRAAVGVPEERDRRTTGERNAEAIGDLARMVLGSGTLGEHQADRPHLLVSVEHDTLLAAADAAGVDPAVLTHSQTPLPRSVLDRIACDCELTRIVFGAESEVLDVGRARRIVTPAQRKAVIARDRTCRGPSCHAPPRICEVHHLIPWQRGGPTSVDNSGLFCNGCHDWIHANDITVTHVHGVWTFATPDGRILTRTDTDDQLAA